MILLSLLLAHLLGDFYFQTDQMANDKSRYLRRHLMHHLILYLAALILIFLFSDRISHFFVQVILPALFLVVLHGAIDRLKSMLSHWRSGRLLYQLQIFIIDQCLHFLSIVLVCALFLAIRIPELANQIQAILEDGGGRTLSPVSSLLFLVLMFLVATTVSGHLIRILVGIIPDRIELSEGKYVLKNPHDQTDRGSRGSQYPLEESYTYLIQKKSDRSRGVLIGYLERLLVIVLILNNAFSGIAFIIAAKSIARFKQLDDRDFAEYFLLGTLASIFLGIVYGLIIKWVLF